MMPTTVDETRPSRASRAVAWSRLLLVSVLLSTTSHHLSAQGNLGKLEGRVTGSTGQPLAEAQVVIVGTAFGAVTNAHGYYFINNLPAGQVEVRATFIGYQAVEVQGLRILAGQTLTQDFTLDPRVLELEQITVIAAANVLVPRDEVTTRQRMDGRYTDALPGLEKDPDEFREPGAE